MLGCTAASAHSGPVQRSDLSALRQPSFRPWNMTCVVKCRHTLTAAVENEYQSRPKTSRFNLGLSDSVRRLGPLLLCLAILMVLCMHLTAAGIQRQGSSVCGRKQRLPCTIAVGRMTDFMGYRYRIVFGEEM